MRIVPIRYILLGLALLVLISSGSGINQQAVVNVPDGSHLVQVAGNGIEQPSETLYASDEILVRFVPGGNRAAIAGLHARIGVTVKKDFTPYGLEGLQVVKLPPGLTVSEAIGHYSKNPNVLYAEPNYVVQATEIPAEIPNDYSFNDLWGLHNTGQTGGTADSDIDAPEAWNLTTGSADVIVAVVDSGVDYNHPDLAENIWANPDEKLNGIDDDENGLVDDIRGWDFINNENDPWDDNSHGTHCAGTIGAVGNNEIGVAGVMWTVQIMPLKFLGSDGSGYTSDAIEAIYYANSKGAHVISNSWGGGSYSQTLKDAIDASDAVVVCAAGNNGKNTDRRPFYPASYTSSQIIAVAATDDEDDLASWSNYGFKSVDVAAPGVNILSTVPGGYGWKSGTSMATPHVAGLAGLLKASNQEMTNIEIKERIMATVDWDPALAGKIASGGRINAYEALSPEYQPEDPVLTSIEVSPEIVTLNIENTLQFTALAKDQDGNIMDGVTFNWESSDTAIGIINEFGLFTAQAPGECTVIAISDSVNGTASVTVTETAQPVLDSIDVTPPSATLDIGATQQFAAVAKDQDGKIMEGVAFNWTSSNDTVGTINENGFFTATGEGTCTVTATTDGSVTGMAEVMVNPAGGIDPMITGLDPSSIAVGSSKFKLTVTGENFVSGAKVLWNSTERKTVFLSSTQLRAWILASDVATAGDYNVTVRNPDDFFYNNLTFTVDPA